MSLTVEIKQNKAINMLLNELEASPQRKGAVLTRSFNEGIKSFYEEILGGWDEGGIPVWSGFAKSAFDYLADQYGVIIDWSTDPSVPRVGTRKPSLKFVGTAAAPQVTDSITGSSGQWNWILDIDITDPRTGKPYVEMNEFSGPTPPNAQRDRPWGLFERARKRAIREINATVQRRLQKFVDTNLRAVSGATTNG